MSMHVVDIMEQNPGQCMCCGTAPRTVDGKPYPAIDLEVDINWGDSAYLCYECVNIAADLFDRVPRAKAEKIIEQNKFLNRRNKELAEELETANNLIARIRDGQAAVKEARSRGN